MGGGWRIYAFVEGTVAHDRIETPQDFYTCAKAFGTFQRQLAEYPAERLHETIVNFHNTPVRYENLMRAIEKDAVGRVAEVEADLSKVTLDLGLFELYAKGFLEGCDGKLTDAELELLPVGAMMMTLECGMRFLTDYLEGDVYFRIHRPKHNLERAQPVCAGGRYGEKTAPNACRDRKIEVKRAPFCPREAQICAV